ncbi:MAG: retron St85 family RNA-directed DNA polymerase [Phenylobacterium sp.]|uniref:retron St85 family RNA-directed DNA polymerase n=1 Tax=Phenylobacterium sp. TaxID=1871053 RepID=UPI0025D0015B|nr:retron St85 family RNA-directed DNA polymerase [Phenylobacterium sp.]MCG9915757.1 retron St85 family RNA-directed DNA polymerase [Phenylobacterium sp.]
MLIDRLCKQTGLTRAQIDRYAETASNRYKTYSILKRNGNERIISQPSREIKALQRWLVRVLFQHFPVHQSATAYAKGSSIRINAERHVDSNYTLRVDFQDFFSSFRSEDVGRFLSVSNQKLNFDIRLEDISIITKIVSRHGRLTVGAPSSPMLTNIMMYDFDYHLNKWACERDVVYTRYADDIFLSAMKGEHLNGAMGSISSFASDFVLADIKINSQKTVFLSRKARRSITGLVITTDRDVSIGRDRKRKIKSLIYLQKMGILENSKLSYLRGMLSFISDVEPEFYETLSRKFGDSFVSAIMNGAETGVEDALF